MRTFKSPNNGIRYKKITHVVLHYTTSENLDGTIAWFMTPTSKVSAHYAISRTGEVVSFVPENRVAWHARGANAYSIGIELCAKPGQAITPEQTAALGDLLADIQSRHGVLSRNIIGHKQVIRSCTDCPGNLFDEWGGVQGWVKENLKIL